MKVIKYNDDGHALVRLTPEDEEDWAAAEKWRKEAIDRATCHPALGYHATPHVGCILR
jgi:hypothetical protein